MTRKRVSRLTRRAWYMRKSGDWADFEEVKVVNEFDTVKATCLVTEPKS